MKKLTIVMTFLVIAIFITSCQVQQRVPPPPGAIQPAPIGEAGAALPNWAADAGTAVSITPNTISIAPDETIPVTVAGTDDYVWRKFYILGTGQMQILSRGPATWHEYHFPCTPLEGTDWCTGPVNRQLNITTREHFIGTNYIIAYTCDWDEDTGAFDCSGNRWKLATFNAQYTNATNTTSPTEATAVLANSIDADVTADLST